MRISDWSSDVCSSDLRRQSKHSVGWSIVRFMSDQFFSFVIFVLLARLLTRADIGAFAIMAIFAEVFRTISAAGLIQTVAREPVLTDEFTDTVYRAHMGFSLIACAQIGRASCRERVVQYV